jgi:hypothetical protein
MHCSAGTGGIAIGTASDDLFDHRICPDAEKITQQELVTDHGGGRRARLDPLPVPPP